MKHLDPTSLNNMSNTCKRLHTVASHDELWERPKGDNIALCERFNPEELVAKSVDALQAAQSLRVIRALLWQHEVAVAKFRKIPGHKAAWRQAVLEKFPSAVAAWRAKVVMDLLKEKEYIGNWGVTVDEAFKKAVADGDFEVATALLAFIDKDDDGNCWSTIQVGFQVAVGKGHTAIVAAILCKWNNRNESRKWGVEEAFKTAARAGDAATINLLLSEVKEGWEYVVHGTFQEAAKSGQAEIVNLLLPVVRKDSQNRVVLGALKAVVKAGHAVPQPGHVAVAHSLQPVTPQALSMATDLEVREILNYLARFPDHDDDKVLGCVDTITEL